MKNKKANINIKTIVIILLIGIIIALICIILNMKNINTTKAETIKEQLAEETNDNTYVDMQSHLTEVEEQEEKLLLFKSAIATAITNEGVSTSSTDTETTMASNIANILKTKTSGATATENDIAKGKTAWVNGELITGNATVGNSVQAVQYGSQYANLNTTSFSLTGISNYNKLTLWKNLFIRTSIVQGNNGGLSEVQSYVNISYNASSGTLSVVNSNTGCFVYFYVYYIPQS